MKPSDLILELEEALALHEIRRKQPYSGVYHFIEENELIESVREKIDKFLGIDTSGLKGNEQIIKILENLNERNT